MDKKNCKKWFKNPSKNPLTNRNIKPHKQTFKKLSKDCEKFVTCTKMRGLHNINQSCYMDSVLFALFAKPNAFITRHILHKKLTRRKKLECNTDPALDLRIRKELQHELNRVTHSIRVAKNINYCSALRGIFAKCPYIIDFAAPGDQEAGEFLQYLFKIFNVGGAKKEVINFGTNSLAKNPRKKIKTSSRIFASTPIQFIGSFRLLEVQPYTDLKTFLANTEDSGELKGDNLFYAINKVFRRRISKEKLIATPYLVFYLQRAHPIPVFRFNDDDEEYDYDYGESDEEDYDESDYDESDDEDDESDYDEEEGGRVITTKIIPNRKITLSKKTLTLTAIVVHMGTINSGHYIAYIKCGRIWYEYNDVSPKLEKIGTYDDMLQHYPSPLERGTLYFYL